MQPFIRLAAFLACAAFLPSALANDEPDSLFFDAYQQYQAGERMEAESRPADAREHFERAEEILRSIKRKHRDWQPLVVDYRLNKTEEALKRVRNAPANAPQDDDLAGPLPLPDPMGNSVNTPATSPIPDFSPRQSRETPYVDGGQRSGREAANREEVLEMARKLRQSEAERQRMDEQLQQMLGRYKSAQHALDKRNVDILELRSLLEQVRQEFDNFKKDAEHQAKGSEAWQKEIEGLRTELREAYAEIEALTDEKSLLITQLERAKGFLEQYATQQEELTAQRDSALEEREAFRERARDYLREIDRYRGEAERYYAEAERYKVKVEAADSLRQQLDLLSEENKSLSNQLANAEKQIEKIKSEGVAENETVLQLRSEINGVRDQLLAAQVELQQKDSTILGLQAQFDETSGELASLKLNPVPREEERKLTAENELLRGIVMRQIKQQARLEQARRMIQEELQRLEVRSDSLDQQLVELSEVRIELTDEEKALFKQPVVALVDSESGNVAGMAVAVAKSAAAELNAEGEAAAQEEPVAPSDPRALPAEMYPLVEKAKQQFEEGRFEAAEETYEEIVAQVPDSYFGLSNLAVTQFQLSKFSAAEVALRKAIALEPEDSFAFTILGIVLFRQGDLEGAQEMLADAIAVNPKDHKAFNYLGITMFEQGDARQAESHIQEALSLNPDYADAHFNLAVVYALSKPPSKGLARQHYDKATELGALPDASLEQLLQ